MSSERNLQPCSRRTPDKCEFLRPELEYLGHLITKDGVKRNPNKISAVSNFKRLTKVKEVMSFLGLAGYYRKFIKNFSTIAKPLTELTKKGLRFDWSPDCETSFLRLKEYLCPVPVLKFPNYN